MNRTVARLSVVVLALLAATPASADDDPKKVAVSVNILTELNIAEVTLDIKTVGGWMKSIVNDLETKFMNETQTRVVVVQVTLHPKAPAEITVAGDLALSAAESQTILKSADATKAPHSKVADCSFQVVAQINGAKFQGNAALTPRISTPDEKWLAEFQEATTTERLALMRKWARTEALPILSAIASKADAKYSGVVNLGKSIAGADPDAPLDVAALTERSPDYWRAMLEMVPSVPTVPAVRVVLHVANGEIDQAGRVAEMARLVDGKKSGPSRILGEFWAMHKIFTEGVNAKIQEGIALHDQGKFAEALKVYDDLLREYPRSAWANYEQFQTKLMMANGQEPALEKVTQDWPRTRAAILASDSLYPMLAMAEGQAEQNALLRRMKINELFKDKSKTKEDLLAYAEIALDLKVYGMAGLLYWDSVLIGKPDEAEVNDRIEHFLYCLDKLGVKTLQENFKGDHEAEFAKIKAEQTKRMSQLGGKK